jgi:plastocyanin domain-containing protein
MKNTIHFGLLILVDELENKAESFAAEGKTPIYVSVDGRSTGLVAVAGIFLISFVNWHFFFSKRKTKGTRP